MATRLESFTNRRRVDKLRKCEDEDEDSRDEARQQSYQTAIEDLDTMFTHQN